MTLQCRWIARMANATAKNPAISRKATVKPDMGGLLP
jgi:hypothetical protein